MMNIPFITKWLQRREVKKQIDGFVKLQMRQMRIIGIKRQIDKLK